MRKIAPLQILVFSALLALVAAASLGAVVLVDRHAVLGDFRALVLVVVGLLAALVFAVVVFRLFLRLFPLREGEIPAGSGQEFVYHVYLLFFLLLFHPIIRGNVVPVPLMRLFYQALGARLGPNTFSSGILWDPGFIRIGANTIVGHGAMLIPHVIEGHRLAHYPITVGDDVTIGAHATVLAGTTIGNRAIVSLGAIVRKNSRIGPGEIWGGIPATRIGQRDETDDRASRLEDPSGRPVEIPYRSVEPIDAAQTK